MTVLVSRSMPVTSPRITRAFCWLASTSRVGGAISPWERMPGRHLVEQRLEQVVAGLGDHRDVDVGALERLGAEQAPEAGADHDHLVSSVLAHVGVILLVRLGPILVPAHASTCTSGTTAGHRDAARSGPATGVGAIRLTSAYWAGDPLRPRRHRHRLRQLDRGPPLRRTSGSRSSRRARFGGTCLNVGLHPHEDVRLPGRPRAVRRARAGAGRRDPLRSEPTGRRSGTGSSGGSTRSRTPARSTGRGLPERRRVRRARCRFTGAAHDRHRHRGEITADQIVIAAGTRPVVPDIPGLDTVAHHTSDTVMRIDALPERVGIVGGGFIGGGVRPRLLVVRRPGDADPPAATCCSARRTPTSRRRFTAARRPAVGRAARHHGRRGRAGAATASALDLSDGETPSTSTCCCSRPAARPTPTCSTSTRPGSRWTTTASWSSTSTSAPPRPGSGRSATSPATLQLKHVANQDARVVQHNLLHPDDRCRSATTGSCPARCSARRRSRSVGLTEQEARDAGHRRGRRHAGLRRRRLRLGDGGHATTSPSWWRTARPGCSVGAHLIGPQASILVQPLVQAMSFGQTGGGLARGQYWIHPALTEVVENALLKLEEELS